MSEYVDLLTTLAECEKARYAAEAAAEEARRTSAEKAGRHLARIESLKLALAEARQERDAAVQELQNYVTAVPEWAEKDKARIGELEQERDRLSESYETAVYGHGQCERLSQARIQTLEAALREVRAAMFEDGGPMGAMVDRALQPTPEEE